MAQNVRLDKVFANLGILSRSECKKAAKRGEITVNGTVCTEADRKVDPDRDAICLNGRRLDTRTFVYYMMNKPAGVITATEDKSAQTVLDLLDDKRTDLSPVGRLDKDTTGILLITNDGQMNHRLLSPRWHVVKTYQAYVEGEMTEEGLRTLARGVDIGDEKPTLPAQVRLLSVRKPQLVEISVIEGRFHQIKRMLQAVGNPCIMLHRKSFGPLTLDDALEPGCCRELTEEELQALREQTESK
ncbi:MAG: rRNA pseudouridine synthase [Firmicutes bacterium]|nr:rRNA pseudouridine synthase [Bacillota bacterium]